MKKYKFLFFVLLFGLFFIPKDVFAAEVPVKELVLYNSSWQVLDSCKLSEESCSFAVSPVDGTVLYMRATFNYNFYVGNVYSLEWSFKTGSGSSYSFAPHQPNIGINGEYQDKTNTQWRQETEEIINQNRFRTYYFFTDFTSKNTTSSSAYPPYVQAQISNPASTSFYFESLSLNVTNKGTDTSSIIQNSTQTIIDNQNKNQQQTNEKLDEAENTRKGILSTITNLPDVIAEKFKSLFIPDDDYFSDKFDELTENVEDVLGFLAYPFTLIIETFEFFLTVEDNGSYEIKWDDVKVPNFENYTIIKKGSFDFASLLADSRIASLRNIAFVFINALLLLAFLQLCHNKYNEVFGGDVSTTEFISVAEEYDIDYKTGEISNIKHIEKKTTRRDVN